MKPRSLIFCLSLALIPSVTSAATTGTEEIDWSAFVVEETFTPGDSADAEPVRLWLDLHPGLNWRSTDSVQDTTTYTAEGISDETVVSRMIGERFGRVTHRTPEGDAVIVEMLRLGRVESREDDRWASDRRPRLPRSHRLTMDSQGRVQDLEMEWTENAGPFLPLYHGLVLRAERFMGPGRAQPGDQWTVTVRHPSFPDAVAICRTTFLGFEGESGHPLAVLGQDFEVEIPFPLLRGIHEDRRSQDVIETHIDRSVARGSARITHDISTGRPLRSREESDISTSYRVRSCTATGELLSEERVASESHQETQSTIEYRN
ncbi:hypothetical protein JXA47_10700 [Candidatus Sumerlaeota bacterium]|nr:hypothetical protein [Candidatus Sumerlaeota bacterium]